MFADSLLESSSWENRSRRGWATLASFAAQLFGLALVLLLPVFYIEGIPKLRLLADVPLAAPPGAPPAAPPQSSSHPPSMSNMTNEGQILAPARVPDSIQQISETVVPPTVDLNSAWVPGGTGKANAGPGIPFGLGNGIAAVVPPPMTHAAIPPISVVMEGNLIERVQPEYPAIARTGRIQGKVVLRAIISRAGTIENLQVVSGHPMLVKAALDAVKRWRYRPYMLNGQPVEVETEVMVNFVLQGG